MNCTYNYNRMAAVCWKTYAGWVFWGFTPCPDFCNRCLQEKGDCQSPLHYRAGPFRFLWVSPRCPTRFLHPCLQQKGALQCAPTWVCANVIASSLTRRVGGAAPVTPRPSFMRRRMKDGRKASLLLAIVVCASLVSLLVGGLCPDIGALCSVVTLILFVRVSLAWRAAELFGF